MTFNQWYDRMNYGVLPISRITSIDCSGANITTLKGIEKLIYLESLECNYNDLETLEGVEALKNLKYLICYENNITSLNPIRNLKKLKRLDCHHNKITSIEPIKDLKNLYQLYVTDNLIKDLSWLPKNLKYFNCDQNPVYPIFKDKKLPEIYKIIDQINMNVLSKVNTNESYIKSFNNYFNI